MTHPLTVSLTPAFFYEGDFLLRAQLRCLSEQEFKDFDVLLIDPHYSKRLAYMNELRDHYKLNIVHVPYKPNQEVAKFLDCAVFNAAYCYSESQRIVRYSCWRFVRPDFTRACMEAKSNVDFRFHSISAPNFEGKNDNTETNHALEIWDMKSDSVNWSAVPRRAGQGGATWGEDADLDAPETLFPLNAYGNYMVRREDWMKVNGTDEVITNACHYEDMDFTLRAHNAGIRCERRSHTLYRLSHNYGSHSGRANVLPDHQFKKPCPECEKAWYVLEPNRFDLREREKRGELEMFHEHKVWVCKKCFLSGPIYHAGCGEHTEWIKSTRRTRATIISKYKLGRNLRILIKDMDRQPLSEKVRIYNDSWINPKYYQT